MLSLVHPTPVQIRFPCCLSAVVLQELKAKRCWLCKFPSAAWQKGVAPCQAAEQLLFVSGAVLLSSGEALGAAHCCAVPPGGCCWAV